MTEKDKVAKSSVSPDWFMRGALTRIGDTLDALTGRRWVASSSLATSELIERMKRLLDSEAKEVPGKGILVPHNIKLKMQWDKFSTDSEGSLENLRNELLAAAADHINDSLYYTYAPLHVEVKPDYFTEGVKLFVGFDKFSDEESEAEMNVTITGVQLRSADIPAEIVPAQPHSAYTFRYTINGISHEKRFAFEAGKRISVGRTSNNELVIDEASISKIHASLMADVEGALSVADTGSTNGTFINDERISYGKASELQDGDKMKFGVVEVTFEKLPVASPVVGEEPISGRISIDGMEFESRRAPAVPAPAELPGEKTAEIGEDSTDISDDATEPNYRRDDLREMGDDNPEGKS